MLRDHCSMSVSFIGYPARHQELPADVDDDRLVQAEQSAAHYKTLITAVKREAQ